MNNFCPYITLEDVNPEAGINIDNSDTLLDAYKDAKKQRKILHFLGKDYPLSKTFEFTTHSVEVRGVGSTNRREPSGTGSCLVSSVTDGPGFIFSGRRVNIKDFGIISNSNTWAIESSLVEDSMVDNIHLHVKSGEGMRIFDTYNCRYSRIRPYRDLSGYHEDDDTEYRGFWHDTTTERSGGGVDYYDIQSENFPRGVELGQKSEANGNNRRTSTVAKCGGKRGLTGLRVQKGFSQLNIESYWSEHNTEADLVFKDCGSVSLSAVNCGSVGPTKPDAVIIDNAGPIYFDQARLRMSGTAINSINEKYDSNFSSVEFIDNRGDKVSGERVKVLQEIQTS